VGLPISVEGISAYEPFLALRSVHIALLYSRRTGEATKRILIMKWWSLSATMPTEMLVGHNYAHRDTIRERLCTNWHR